MLVTCGKKELVPVQHPKWRTTHFQLSVTAYSICLQTASILGGRPLQPTKGRAEQWLDGILEYAVQEKVAF
jgi:hypothetical protein